jgi:hypothetical protein
MLTVTHQHALLKTKGKKKNLQNWKENITLNTYSRGGSGNKEPSEALIIKFNIRTSFHVLKFDIWGTPVWPGDTALDSCEGGRAFEPP